MGTPETDTFSSGRRSLTDKILLVGDVSKVFLDADSVSSNYEVCDNISDAIDTASKDSFAAIAVVMYGTAKLGSALKLLRKKCDARIILLAQMYEEPIANQLVSSTFNGASLADDYLICPLEANRFKTSLCLPRAVQKQGQFRLFLSIQR